MYLFHNTYSLLRILDAVFCILVALVELVWLKSWSFLLLTNSFLKVMNKHTKSVSLSGMINLAFLIPVVWTHCLNFKRIIEYYCGQSVQLWQRDLGSNPNRLPLYIRSLPNLSSRLIWIKHNNPHPPWSFCSEDREALESFISINLSLLTFICYVQ